VSQPLHPRNSSRIPNASGRTRPVAQLGAQTDQAGAVAQQRPQLAHRRRGDPRLGQIMAAQPVGQLGGVTFVEWAQHLPEDERLPFAVDVLDRYQQVAADAPGEENFFRFYQMDITLSPR